MKSDPTIPRTGAIKSWPQAFWRRAIEPSNPRRTRAMGLVTFAMIAVIGAVDFASGFELSLLLFYFLPICLAVTSVGWRFGVLTAAVSVGTWLGGDFAAGAHYGSKVVPYWNAAIAFGTYLVLIWLLSSVLALHRDMEERIRERTKALTGEIAERERLERAILEVGERERRSIGHDLHDGLGQHLTGTSLVTQALRSGMEGLGAGPVSELDGVVALIEQGIEQTRSIAKGLLLAEIEREGFVDAMRELAAATSRQFQVVCDFKADEAPDVGANETATHLFRIAQEALRNAARHGHARRLEMTLGRRHGGLAMIVRDDGVGLPPPESRGDGLGLRIMAHRAAIIGAAFSIEKSPRGGTIVECLLPPRP